MEKRRAYLDQLLSFMIEPSQDDFIFVSHRDDDDLGHNHDGDLGTELRSAAVRECKELARQQPFEPAGAVVQTAMAELRIDPGVKPVNERNVVRCLQREREAAFPRIDFDDPDYEVNLACLKGTFVFFNLN